MTAGFPGYAWAVSSGCSRSIFYRCWKITGLVASRADGYRGTESVKPHGAGHARQRSPGLFALAEVAIALQYTRRKLRHPPVIVTLSGLTRSSWRHSLFP